MALDVSRVGWATYNSPCFDFPVENKWGYSMKVVLRSVAKKLPEYHTPVEPVRHGRSDSGEEIPVNTLGRWAFGVPGYQGHCIFDGFCKHIKIYYPKCGKELEEALWVLFSKAVSALE